MMNWHWYEENYFSDGDIIDVVHPKNLNRYAKVRISKIRYRLWTCRRYPKRNGDIFVAASSPKRAIKKLLKQPHF